MMLKLLVISILFITSFLSNAQEVLGGKLMVASNDERGEKVKFFDEKGKLHNIKVKALDLGDILIVDKLIYKVDGIWHLQCKLKVKIAINDRPLVYVNSGRIIGVVSYSSGKMMSLQGAATTSPFLKIKCNDKELEYILNKL